MKKETRSNKLMLGNERDCLCAKPKGKHEEYCDAYRWSEFSKKAVGILCDEKNPNNPILRV